MLSKFDGMATSRCRLAKLSRAMLLLMVLCSSDIVQIGVSVAASTDYIAILPVLYRLPAAATTWKSVVYFSILCPLRMPLVVPDRLAPDYVSPALTHMAVSR